MAWTPRPAGIRYLVTELELLCHSHAVVPLRIRSVSPICTGAERRSFRGPPYQIFSVCDPASSEVIVVRVRAPRELRDAQRGGLDHRAGQRREGAVVTGDGGEQLRRRA